MHIKASNKRRTFKQYVTYNIQQMKVSEIQVQLQYLQKSKKWENEGLKKKGYNMEY